jgi:tricorn protease-like protein
MQLIVLAHEKRALADASWRTITAAHGRLNSPRYSPDGGTIAWIMSAAFPDFAPASGVYTIPLHGSSAQRITPLVSRDATWTYTSGNAWSSDGEWIVATTIDRMHVINVKTGLTLPLPWSDYDYSDPAWKPG